MCVYVCVSEHVRMIKLQYVVLLQQFPLHSLWYRKNKLQKIPREILFQVFSSEVYRQRGDNPQRARSVSSVFMRVRMIRGIRIEDV